MMIFTDEEVTSINIADADSLSQLIVEYLCGEKYYKNLSGTEKNLLSNLLHRVDSDGLNYAQFNELLLLLDQDRINEAFFDFFFGKEAIGLEGIRQGIIKFRGFAMLCFGNFRFAYKQLIQKNKKELEESLEQYCKPSEKVLEYFGNRPPKALDVDYISKDKTWFNGFISKRKYEKEAEYMHKLIEEGKPVSREVQDLYSKMGEAIKEVQQKALRNTDIYLTWDYMDVYIATSMRQRWEYEEVFDFVQKIFIDDVRLKALNLRYFDPTQSACVNRIDKGLIEGLMLKRSLCTIYMAQEVDSMGKDSELAATLAQRKPVIAYIPSINISEHAKKISKYPLDFFKMRFTVLRAEEIFDDETCNKKLKEFDPKFEQTINSFEQELNEYRCSQPFSLWDVAEKKFKEGSKFFPKICRILSIAEHFSFENRAMLLKARHPLAIQVHLESGVANGVLVVRNPEHCADLLYNILSNSMNFKIKYIKEKEEKKNGQTILLEHGMTELEEQISQCPFRIVTGYEKLTNSFWNFYLCKKEAKDDKTL